MSSGFSSETVRAERTRILSALLDDTHRLAALALEAMRAEIPAYAARDRAFHDDVRDQVVRHYRTTLAVLLEDRAPTAGDIGFTRAAAMRRARAGIALADYINAFRVGLQVFWDSVVERAGDSPAGHEAALTLAAPIMTYCDVASTYAANAYMECQQYAAAAAAGESRDLLETLLAGNAPSRGGQLATAHAYGLDPGTSAPLLVVVAILLGPQASGAKEGTADLRPVPAGVAGGAGAHHAACAAIARAAGNGTNVLAAVRQAEIVAVPVLGPGGDAVELCARLQRVRESLLAEGIVAAVGVSTVVLGTADIPCAYREARTALEFLPEDGGIAALPEITPFQYLALRADDTARHLVDPRITALLAEDRARGGVLTATIRAFADADLNLRASAERLQIHPNTAQYRLRRIQERTGCNLRRIDDLMELLVAIALYDSLATWHQCGP
ncbi:helix-turn-helix domain-containing protein [Streptosporangiaceae bacterium NEAU-GS5]|nr:helix-turn-helix domain-containing protein [Streptosporangiaceae bacterium NEAU-GS5]